MLTGMKRFLVMATFLSVSFISWGQLSVGVKAGININEVIIKDLPREITDDSNSGTGFYAGVYGKVKITDKLSFIPELQFSQKGTRDNGGDNVKLNYLELPLLVAYTPLKWIGIDLGASVSYRLSTTFSTDRPQTTFDDFKDKDFDLGLIGGLRVPLFGRVSVLGRYYLGVTPVAGIEYRFVDTETITTKEYMRTVQLGLNYRLK